MNLDLKDKISNLALTIERLSNDLITRKALYFDKKDILDKINNNILDIESKTKLFKDTSNFLTKFSSSTRESVSLKIEQLVTYILRSILEIDRYNFKILFATKRNIVEASFVLHDNLNDADIDILNSSGGGIADIVSVVLFFAFLEISNTKSDFIILDEVGKHISADRRDKFFDLLKTMSIDYKKQILYISHQAEILEKANNIVKIGLDNNGNSIII